MRVTVRQAVPEDATAMAEVLDAILTRSAATGPGARITWRRTTSWEMGACPAPWPRTDRCASCSGRLAASGDAIPTTCRPAGPSSAPMSGWAFTAAGRAVPLSHRRGRRPWRGAVRHVDATISKGNGAALASHDRMGFRGWRGPVAAKGERPDRP